MVFIFISLFVYLLYANFFDTPYVCVLGKYMMVMMMMMIIKRRSTTQCRSANSPLIQQKYSAAPRPQSAHH